MKNTVLSTVKSNDRALNSLNVANRTAKTWLIDLISFRSAVKVGRRDDRSAEMSLDIQERGGSQKGIDSYSYTYFASGSTTLRGL